MSDILRTPGPFANRSRAVTHRLPGGGGTVWALATARDKTAGVEAQTTDLLLVIDGYLREGKNFITNAVVCTGGHHRSVAMTEELGRRLASHEGLDVSVIHRDISRG